MKPFTITASLALLLILPLESSARDEYEHLEKTIPYEKLGELQVDVEIGIADLVIGQAKGDNLLEAEIRYNVRRGEPKINFKRSGDVGYLTIESGDKKKDYDGDDANKGDEDWKLLFGTRIATSFNVEIGLVDAAIDLSGLKVIGFDVSGGLSDIELSFNEPNSEKAKEMTIEVGLGEFTGINLGNANFTKLKLENGLGEAKLDLGGTWRVPEAQLNLDVGLGSATIEIPEGIGVEVFKEDNFLSSVDLDHSIRKVRKGHYRTVNFDDAQHRLTIEAEVGLGCIKIKIVD